MLRTVERSPFSKRALNHAIFTDYDYQSVMPVFLQSLSRPLNQDHSNSIGTSSKGTCFAPMGFVVLPALSRCMRVIFRNHQPGL
jgi:hypothetical protein